MYAEELKNTFLTQNLQEILQSFSKCEYNCNPLIESFKECFSKFRKTFADKLYDYLDIEKDLLKMEVGKLLNNDSLRNQANTVSQFLDDCFNILRGRLNNIEQIISRDLEARDQNQQARVEQGAPSRKVFSLPTSRGKRDFTNNDTHQLEEKKETQKEIELVNMSYRRSDKENPKPRKKIANVSKDIQKLNAFREERRAMEEKNDQVINKEKIEPEASRRTEKKMNDTHHKIRNLAKRRRF